MINKVRILFFGSSDFAVPVLEELIAGRWKIVGVVTQPDRPKGRKKVLSPTPVKAIAKKNNLPVFEFVSLLDREAKISLTNLEADVAVVVSYGQIIPKDVLSMCRLGFINIHPSMLPKYRGASPIQFALLNGELKTGVSVMLMDEKLDHGPIIAQQEIKISSNDNFIILHDKLSALAAKMIKKNLKKFIAGKIYPTKQDDYNATFTKTLTREDGQIVWKKPADAIIRQITAFNPWPSSWTRLNGRRIKIMAAKIIKTKFLLSPGQISVYNNKLFVGCGNRTIVEVITLQPEGKTAMNALDYINGNPEVHNQRFDWR